MSRIGKRPIDIPKEVKIAISDDVISAEGQKGKLCLNIPASLIIEQKDAKIILSRKNESRPVKALHGLTRVLIANMIKGVAQGYSKQLEIVGVGFRAEVKGEILNMQLGFSHPVNFPIPKDIKIQTPKPTQILVTGIDKQRVGEISAQIRRIFPPEPYKGKGIRYSGEYVKRKIGKAITK